MVGCDCELACDRSVLLELGSDTGDSYMITILEVARRICATRTYAGVKTLGGGMFLSEKSEKRFMERRYANMKLEPVYKHPKPVIIIVFIVCAIFGTAATAACGLPQSISGKSDSVTLVSYTTGTKLLDEAIRAYYGINSDQPITSDMLDGVTAVEFRASEMLADVLGNLAGNTAYTYSEELLQKAKDGIFVEFVINGTVIDLLETQPTVSRFENTLAESVNEIGNSDFYQKWMAFYCKKDPADPKLSDDDRAAMIAQYPQTLTNPEYIFDPYATVREKGFLIDIAYKSGLLDCRYLEDGLCDASSLSTLHNLKSAVFTGITPVNFDDTLKVRSEAETENIESDKLYEAAADSAGQSVSTGCAQLDEAIRAYYGINAEEPITGTMLSGILTLKICDDTLTNECFPADGEKLYGYAAQIREKLNAGSYISFVINGKKIDVMETYVFGTRYEGTIKKAIQKFSDTHEKAIYGTASNLWSVMYSYKNADDPSLTNAAVMELTQVFPETMHHSIYVLDPYLSVRETAQMLEIAYGAGLLDNKYLPGPTFDVSSLDSLPRLISFAFEGIAITGTCAVLDG
jgi:Glucokinase